MISSWSVTVGNSAERDLKNIRDYIANEFGDMDNALKVMRRIRSTVLSLDTAPFIHRVHPEPALSELGMRYVISGSYVILFTVDEDENSVFVHHVRHVHQNVSALGEKKNSIGGFSDA